MAAHLAGLPTASRQSAFEAMLAAIPDRVELLADLADYDPQGPAPEDDEDAGEDWLAIRLGTLPSVDVRLKEVWDGCVDGSAAAACG
ncbi:MAG: hypothetical protein ACP5XB_18475, partial [Isosphaeraceae bacterium]